MIDAGAESPTALVAGLAIVVLGALIKYRHWTTLIDGYDASSEVPDAVAADVVGNLAIRVGIATTTFGVFAAVVSVHETVALAFVAIVVLAAARAVYRLQTYQPTAA